MLVAIVCSESNEYKQIGKLGCALLGNYGLHTFRFVMYTGKQNYLVNQAVNADFNFIVQENNYLTFNDDKKVPWTLLFASKEQQIEFLRNFGFLKFLSAESEISSQDLTFTPSSSQSVKEDDAIQIKYTASSTEAELKSCQVFDENDKFRTKLDHFGQDAIKALTGLRVNGKRLICCSQSCFKQNFPQIHAKLVDSPTKEFAATLNISSDSVAPENMIFLLEIELVKIKSKKEANLEPDVKEEQQVVAQVATQEERRERSSSKSELLQRMAKLGMPTMFAAKGVRMQRCSVMNQRLLCRWKRRSRKKRKR